MRATTHLAHGEELVGDSGVHEGGEEISVAGRVPLLFVLVDALHGGEEGVGEDTRVARLVEGKDLM